MTKLNRINASVNEHAINEVALTAQESSRLVGAVAMVANHLPDFEGDLADGAAIALSDKQGRDQFRAVAGAHLSRLGVSRRDEVRVLLALLVSFCRASLGLWRLMVRAAALNIPRLLVVACAQGLDVRQGMIRTHLRSVALRVSQSAQAMVFKMGSPLLRSCGRFCDAWHARNITLILA